MVYVVSCTTDIKIKKINSHDVTHHHIDIKNKNKKNKNKKIYIHTLNEHIDIKIKIYKNTYIKKIYT